MKKLTFKRPRRDEFQEILEQILREDSKEETLQEDLDLKCDNQKIVELYQTKNEELNNKLKLNSSEQRLSYALAL